MIPMTNFWIPYLMGAGTVFLGSFILLGILYLNDVRGKYDDEEIQESNSERQDTHSIN